MTGFAPGRLIIIYVVHNDALMKNDRQMSIPGANLADLPEFYRFGAISVSRVPTENVAKLTPEGFFRECGHKRSYAILREY